MIFWGMTGLCTLILLNIWFRADVLILMVGFVDRRHLMMLILSKLRSGMLMRLPGGEHFVSIIAIYLVVRGISFYLF